MSLKSGEKIEYRFVGERAAYSATVRSADEDTIVLETKPGAHAQVAQGQYLIIVAQDENYNAEVIGTDGAGIRLRRLRTDKQEYFRVEDFFPVVARRVARDFPGKKSAVSITFGKESLDRNAPDETIHPKLWDLLVSINDKLNLLLDRMNLEPEAVEAEPQNVNISASGIKFTMKEMIDQGDFLEVKMLLPSTPPVTVVAYGNAVSVQSLGGGGCAVALQFVDMDAEVRDKLIQYTLNRQREIIRRQRQMSE
jgi:hypothetical protein